MKTQLCSLFILVLSLTTTAQVYYTEDFNNCSVPSGMTFENHGDSEGWLIGNHQFHSTQKFPMADNGTCYAAVNDDKYDSEDGTAHIAKKDEMITPWIDISEAGVAALGFEYMTYQGLTLSVYVTQDEVKWDVIYFAPTTSLGGMVDNSVLALPPTSFMLQPLKSRSLPLPSNFPLLVEARNLPILASWGMN